MNNDKPDRVRLYQFYLWVSNPNGVHSLLYVLGKLRDVELLHIMKETTSKQAATLAWAEYGKRHEFAKIDFHQSSLEVLEVGVKDLVFATQLAAA